MKVVGERLKEERIRLGLTQAEFGDLAGVKNVTQSRYESGLNSPNTDYFECIAKYGVDINYILTGKRIAGLILQDEIDVLNKDEREILAYYRNSSTYIKKNMKVVIAALANNYEELHSVIA